MANNPYLYPMKYLLFYIISLLSLTACIHEELPPEGGFALEEGDPLPEFSISNPDGTVSKKDLENKFAMIILLYPQKQERPTAPPSSGSAAGPLYATTR